MQEIILKISKEQQKQQTIKELLNNIHNSINAKNYAVGLKFR